MKAGKYNLISIIFLIAILLSFAACKQRNRLKTDEKALTQQILTEEEQLAKEAELRAKRAKKFADSIAKLPKDFRFDEQRGVDPNQPPIIIDIKGNRNNPQKIQLSKLYSKVKYIRLEPLPDSTEYGIKWNYTVTSKHIYVVTGKGSIYQYNREGEFKSTVCAGNLQYTKTQTGSYSINSEQFSMFEGAKDVYYNGQHLCYRYLNNPKGKGYLVTFDDKSEDSPSLQIPQSVESDEYFKGRGNIFSETKSQSTMLPRHYSYILNNHTMAALKLSKISKEESFISMMTSKGDTICDFKDFDPIINYSKSTVRGVDGGDSYFVDETLYLRQSFNDTVYQLIPPNHMVAKYVFDYGNLRIPSAQKGIDPGYDLENRLVPYEFLETKEYIFITYTKNYSCPNTAKKGTLKFSRLIYDKKENCIMQVYIDEKAHLTEGMRWPNAPELNVENDLDNMPFKWPMQVTSQGEPISIFKGEEFLNMKNKTEPSQKLNKNERIIAIYLK